MSTNVLWPLEPHTRAKHALLKRYLDAWFPIIGKNNSRLNYIDGFAGPGEYEGGEDGSPVLALESALDHVNRGTLSSTVEINFIFIEQDAAHAAHLRSCLQSHAWPTQFAIEVVHGQFRDRIGSILDGIDAKKQRLAPTFAFVDPFGFSGVPMSLMTRILNFPKCEVFVNVMVDFINRFLEHPNDAITAHFPETFGTGEVCDIPSQTDGKRLNLILDLYRRQLKQHAKFVGRFDMSGRQDRRLYSLFFASNAEKGFEKMKEAMWSVDKQAGKQFSATTQTPSLFEPWAFTPLWDELWTQFAGKTVPMSEIEQFVVVKTDFIPKHARELFKHHEASQEIEVLPIGTYKRRAGTYPSDKVRIRFVR